MSSAPIKSSVVPSVKSSAVSGANSARSEVPKSHVSPVGQLPTLDDVAAVPGIPLTHEELQQLQHAGSVPKGINLTMHPSMHKVKQGEDEYLVLMVDAPPCACRKVNGKKERCRQHRAIRRTKKRGKKAKKGIKDDDSDRKKLAALRHADDSEEDEDAIAGAITPDKVCIIGPAGAAVLIPIDTAENPNAAAKLSSGELPQPVHGILVKGPQDVPQFIPNDKIPKDERGQPKFANCTPGTLMRNGRGEHVFFADGGCKFDVQGNAIDMVCSGADPNVVKAIGDKLHMAGMVDVNQSGMPVFLLIDEKNPAPQDKLATVGVIASVDGQNVFLQTKGQTVGSGDGAAVIPATREGAVPVGTVIGEVVYNKANGKIEDVPPGQANGREVVGMVVQGGYNQPVLVATKGGRLDKPGCVNYEAAKAKTMIADDWTRLLGQNEGQQRRAAPAIENNNVTVASFVTGKSLEVIRREMEEVRKNSGWTPDVISQSFQQGYCPNRSVFMKSGGGLGGAGRSAGASPRPGGSAAAAGGGGGGYGGAGGSPYEYESGEVRSKAYSAAQTGGTQSVYMK